MCMHACMCMCLRWMRRVHGKGASILQKKCWSKKSESFRKLFCKGHFLLRRAQFQLLQTLQILQRSAVMMTRRLSENGERAGVKQNHNKSEDGSAQTDSKTCTADVPQEHKNKYITGAGSSDLIDSCVYVWLSAVKVDHRFTFVHLSIFFGIIVFHFHASHRQTKGVSCLICAVE